MNNLNSILIEGNLVKDPMMRETPKGEKVTTFQMSSNRYFKTDTGIEKEVSFFTIETWGKLAELVYEKGKKGRGVRAVGRLRQERWTDQDGKQRERIAIVSEHVEFRPEFKVGSDQVDDDQYQSVAEETAEEKPKRKSTKKAEETAEEKPKKRQPKKQKA